MKHDVTVVLDVGARYGMHPSWASFNGNMKYLMFEPDKVEADRLRENLDRNIFEVFETALGKENCKRKFYLLKHRGLSSFLKPDFESECFRRLKPGQAQVEKEIELQIQTIDSVMRSHNITVDFLKIDTEGTEHDVIEGASEQIDNNILGIRSSCNFQACFVGQKLFSETHDYLLKKDFILLNLDYCGYGYPRLGLFRKPEPIEPENYRYGILVAADAVWIRRPESCTRKFKDNSDMLTIAILKLTSFCIHNHAADVGIDILREHILNLKESISSDIVHSRLYQGVKLDIANFLGRWRTVPDEQWEKVRRIFEEIYKEPLVGGSDFYPQIQTMKTKLQNLRT